MEPSANDTTNKQNNDISEYRNALLQADEAAVREYDKTVIYLSGGAIGVSFTFLKSVLESGSIFCGALLLFAWFLWGLSVLSVLISHYCSHRAMRRALKDLSDDNLNYSNPGRGWDVAINILNPIGGFLFIFGLMVFLIFVGFNFFLNGNKQNEQANAIDGIHATKTVTVTTTTITSDLGEGSSKHKRYENDDEAEPDSNCLPEKTEDD